LLLLKEYFVNDATVKSNYKVKAFSTRDADASSFENHIVPENIPLTLFMKMTLLLINKSQEWLFIPDMETIRTLVHALAYHFDNLPMNSSERPGLVHRIDKDTSGLLVIAKTEVAMSHLAKQFEAKTSEREYVALCGVM
jgi:23S rRNA pseudouridine1911/1915/1917 synthase